jgi:hypothetical protein
MNYVFIINIIDMIFTIMLSLSLFIQMLILLHKFFISKKELTGKELIIVILINALSDIYYYLK